jgi:Protein of unknown function (DUF3040)
MLSDADKQRLTEIETQLRADDPGFVDGFDQRVRAGVRPGWRQLAAVSGGVVAALVCGAGLAFGNVGTVVIALSAAGATVGLWVAQCRRP